MRKRHKYDIYTKYGVKCSICGLEKKENALIYNGDDKPYGYHRGTLYFITNEEGMGAYFEDKIPGNCDYVKNNIDYLIKLQKEKDSKSFQKLCAAFS